jgi:hypothetical protein
VGRPSLIHLRRRASRWDRLKGRYCSVSTAQASGIAEIHHRYVVTSPDGATPVEGEALVTGPGQVLPPDEM